jgi:hypothetical protein
VVGLQRNKTILQAVFFLILGVGLVFSASVYAVENENEGGAMEEIVIISASEEEAFKEIATQLVEIEEEINRLSLLVSKYVLEKQALALQQQVLEYTLVTQENTDQIVVGMPESAGDQMEDVSFVAPTETEEEDIETTDRSDIFGSLTIQEKDEGKEDEEIEDVSFTALTEDEEDEETGLLAAVKGIGGNLQTPEIVTIFILVILAIFVIVRRVVSRKRKTPSTLPNAPLQEQQALDEQRQELQDRVAWK